jgi:hypothetical protein
VQLTLRLGDELVDRVDEHPDVGVTVGEMVSENRGGIETVASVFGPLSS